MYFKRKLQQFLTIANENHLNWLARFTFAVHFMLGAVILPFAFKLGFEALAEFAHALSMENMDGIASVFEKVLYLFRYIQWPLFAVIVAVYWFRCNVKAYNYAFTQDCGMSIRRQLAEGGDLICPRCGNTMKMKKYIDKVLKQTGEHEEYYTEWIGYGKNRTPVMQKEIVRDYSYVDYKRQYPVCQNQYCRYEDKKPSKGRTVLYKFREMPYKISDTLDYVVRIETTTKPKAGNLHQYPHGVSWRGCLVISILIYAACAKGNFSCINFLNQQNELYEFLVKLAVSESIVFCGAAVFQYTIRKNHGKRNRRYVEVEIENETKDGSTILFPDGTQMYARTDPELQKMADLLRNRDKNNS